MNGYLERLAEKLRDREGELLSELGRVRAALSVLRSDEERETPRPDQARKRRYLGALEPYETGSHDAAARAALDDEEDRPRDLRVVQLPAAIRSADAGREAPVDDVLALVFLQFSDPRKIRAFLSADFASVMRRLYDLRRDGLVERIRGGWYVTDEARSLNWIENRARELARVAEER